MPLNINRSDVVMKDKDFKKLCHEEPYLPDGFEICNDMPSYNPDFCCFSDDGTYLVYESESGSNKKAHVGAFLEACYAAEQKGANTLYLFFVQKEYKTNITVKQLPTYFRPYVNLMKEKMTGFAIQVYFISDNDFKNLKNKDHSILNLLGRFMTI